MNISRYTLKRLERRYLVGDIKFLRKSYKNGPVVIKRKAVSYLGYFMTKENFGYLINELKSTEDDWIKPNIYDSLNRILISNQINIQADDLTYLGNLRMKYGSEEELVSIGEELIINGHKLPISLISRIRKGGWKNPINEYNLDRLLVEESPYQNQKIEIAKYFEPYKLKTMISETEGTRKWDESEIWIWGKDDNNIKPGKIDIENLILIADFGIGMDAPIGLDYRCDKNNPCVIFMYTGMAVNESRWKRIADNFEEFEKILFSK